MSVSTYSECLSVWSSASRRFRLLSGKFTKPQNKRSEVNFPEGCYYFWYSLSSFFFNHAIAITDQQLLFLTIVRIPSRHIHDVILMSSCSDSGSLQVRFSTVKCWFQISAFYFSYELKCSLFIPGTIVRASRSTDTCGSIKVLIQLLYSGKSN